MKRTGTKKHFLILALSVFALFFCLAFGALTAEAKTITIMDPEDMKNINWVKEGFGPGNTYKLGADMTLGEGDDATVLLTKGNFVIDFNGHTLQNSNNALGVFSLRGANVTFKDSKVSNDKASIRSYGAGAIDMTAGTLVIQSGNYIGLSDGTNNPSGLHVGGGTCVVNGGFFYGEAIGATCVGATLYINGGTFQTGYMFALEDFGNSKISISKANFISGTTTYGYQFSLGAYVPNQEYYDFSTWLAKGSSFSYDFQTGYWNMQSNLTAYPAYGNCFAVSYNTPTLSITSNVRAAKTAIKKIKPGKKQLKVAWKKKAVSGYVLQIATNKKFTKGVKTITVKGKKKTARTVKNLKSGKKYFVRVRTYKDFNKTRIYSKWSKVKTKTVKR